jgi:hypothetical protein
MAVAKWCSSPQTLNLVGSPLWLEFFAHEQQKFHQRIK